MDSIKLTERNIRALKPSPSGDVFLWDRTIPGFGARVKPSGRCTFVVQYRNKHHVSRRLTIGHYPTLRVETARDLARKALAKVSDGRDPAADRQRDRTALTVATLADRYLEEHVKPHNKPSTAQSVRRLVEKVVKPALGGIPVPALTRARVMHWHHELRRTPIMANRALASLSKMMSLAAKHWELRPDNPCQGVQRYAEAKRARFYSDDELKRIGAALAKAERERTELPGVMLAVRLLAVTGMRLGEVLSLRWEDLDLDQRAIWLRDAKAGARVVPLGAPAVALLSALKQRGVYVVPGTSPDKPLSRSSMENTWARLRKRAGIKDGRLHDFRHTSATFAAQAGLNAFTVRDLLGHRTITMASRYVERSTDPLREAADAVSSRVAAALGGKSAAVVKFQRKA